MNARQGFAVRRSAVVGAALAAIIGLVAADPAQAAFIFTLERLSDTEVRLTGAGSVGSAVTDTYDVLKLDGLVSTPGIAIGTTAGTFQLGSFAQNGWLASGGELAFRDRFSFTGTDVASGTSTLTRTGFTAVFAAIGATGNIVVFPAGGTISSAQIAGTWTMVAPVPIQAALPLFGTALAALAVVARRKRNPEPA